MADPGSPGTVYSTDELGLFKSTDAGKTWRFAGGATLKPIGALFDPTRQPIGFLATFRAQPGILYATPFNGGLYRGQFE